MPPSVIIMLLGAISFAATLVYISNRQWISVWRGHRIRIRLQHFKIAVEIDDVPVLMESQSVFNKTHQTKWNHPALGTKMIRVEKIHKGRDGLSLKFEIGDEIIPLFELPTNTLHQAQTKEEESYWNKLMPVDFEQLGDPRWIAACKILQLIRQSKMADGEIRETANILQQQLRSNFEMRRRLSEEDVSLLGNSEDLNQIKTKIEDKILQGLEAVKSLHMVTISLEAHADEKDEMEKVYQTNQYLKAEDEVATFMKPSKKKPIHTMKREQ